MNYAVEQLNLEVVENRFVFKGKVERSDYSDLSRFLKEAEKGVGASSVEFDFRGLEYLNSSGIRAVAVFFLESVKKVTIRINPEVTWQRVGLTPLASIRPNGAIDVRS
jgi:hypothetical protein